MQQQFQDKFISKKRQDNIGEKGNKHSIKSQEQTIYRQQGKKIILTDRGTNRQTLSRSSQQTRKENLKQ